MLQNLRNQSNSLFFKALLVIIALSFFIFGIGDMVRGIFFHKPIAHVGSHTVSMEELDHESRREFQRIQAIKKGAVSFDELNRMGFIDKILDKLINQHAVEQEIARLGIVTSDNAVRNNIHSMEPFLLDGQFDHSKFHEVMQNIGINEKAFVHDIRKKILEQQYFLTFAQAAALPKYYKDLLVGAMLQRRAFSIVTIQTSKMVIAKAPTEQELKQFYEQNKEAYKALETRDIQILELDLKKLSSAIQVTDADLNQVYEKRKDQFFTPEMRHVKKIICATQDEAQIVYDRAKTDFEQIKSKDLKTVKVSDLGMVSKNLLPEADQDAIFALPLNGHTGIIAEKNQYVLYQVLKITPANQKTFGQVKQKLLEDYKLELYQQDSTPAGYKVLKDKLEDELAGGNSLEQAAKSINIPLHLIKNVSKDGKTLDETLKPFAKEVIDNVFQLELNSASPVLDISPEKSIVISVQKITPERMPLLDEIKEKVTNDALSYIKVQKAAELAQKIAMDSKSIGDLAKLASKNQVTLTTNNVYSRMSIVEDKTIREFADSMERAFSVPLEQAIPGRSKDGFVVIMPERDFTLTADDLKKSDELVKRLDTIMAESVADALIEVFKKNQNVKIKTDNLNAYLKIRQGNEA